MNNFHKQNTRPDLTSTESPPQPMPHRIGPYKIESLLSKGGMSYLYLGLHPTASHPIVIKVLSPKHLKNKEIAARFLKEAQIIGMTNHPNIVKLYGQGTWEKGLYIAMEFIQGVSLRQFIQQKSLSQRRALEIILQVAYALCHLHTHGVIHRDLKPENILILESGEIKVIDFGIAQLHDEEVRTIQTKAIIGTPVYMSPEQKENPHSVSYSSDIYSLGILAYELVLGRLSHGIIHLALLPKNLRPIIEKALKVSLDERYQDIVDFITDISHYLKTLDDQEPQSIEEASDEMLNMVQKTRNLLLVKKAPRWPQADLGIAIQEGISLSGLYLDFFRLPENRLCIILAEPFEPGPTSLLSCAILRGMIRMAVSLHTSKKDLHPIKMLSALNASLCEDPMHQKFSLSLLLLAPDKDLLSFVSCGYSSLWHLPEGSKKIKTLSTPNPPLGSDPNSTVLETANNWNSGDTLILHTHPKHEENHIAWLQDHLLLSPQTQAERILQRLTAHPSKRPSAVLSIHRLF